MVDPPIPLNYLCRDCKEELERADFIKVQFRRRVAKKEKHRFVSIDQAESFSEGDM
jgi:hypothetical protein